MKLLKQRLVIEVVFDPLQSIVPEAWDWNSLMSTELRKGETITVISSESLGEADDDAG